MEQELRQMFEMKETEMSVPSTLSPELRQRVGRQRMAMGGLFAAAAMVLVIGGFAGARSLSSDDATPIRPAEERSHELEPVRTGRIVQADGEAGGTGFWIGDTAPPPPGGDQTYYWDAFDQDTGSFLYNVESGLGRSDPALKGLVWVVDQDGLVAEFHCPASSACGRNEMEAFGPGPDEITAAGSGRSVHVIGFDGTLRDTIDISAVFSQGQDLSDLAWSPDGNRLAVSTQSEYQCNSSSTLCEGKVWIFDRDGREPQLAYTERAPEYRVLRDLAWSPDGHTLALLVAPDFYDPEQVPRLVALRMTPDEPVRAETLNLYDDYGREGVSVFADDYHIAFPFAWSPDGTRIAVTSGDGIVEISAENGEVLARRAGEGPEGPLAWLPER